MMCWSKDMIHRKTPFYFLILDQSDIEWSWKKRFIQNFIFRFHNSGLHSLYIPFPLWFQRSFMPTFKHFYTDLQYCYYYPAYTYSYKVRQFTKCSIVFSVNSYSLIFGSFSVIFHVHVFILYNSLRLTLIYVVRYSMRNVWLCVSLGV